jgi:hypothetical protein
MILPSLTDTEFKPDRNYQVGFATKPQGAAKTFVLQVRIPRALLAEIDEPKRILIEGTPHEGYTIKATKDRAEGHAVNYKLGGHFFYFPCAFKRTKLTKVTRRLTIADAHVEDGVVRIGGMPDGWIKGQPEFTGAGAPRPADEHRLAANPIHGTVARGANGSAAVDPLPDAGETVQQIAARLDASLREAATLKAALEKRTGLSFRVSQDLRLVLASDPKS